jgi:transcriptional regulator with XRE-family HTH domain
MPNPQRLEILTELRRKRRLSLAKMAHHFGFTQKGRETVSKWERGLSVPVTRHRTKFISWLCKSLDLCKDQKKLYAVWEILQDEWGFDELKSSEVRAALQDEDILKDEPSIMTAIPMTERLSVGGIITPMIILAWGYYKPKHIRCYYSDQEISFPPDILRLKKNLIEDCAERKARGESYLPYNSLTYKLKSFDVGYRDIVNGQEIPVLNLFFGPTDYFTHCVTDLNVGNPVRDKYMRNAKDITAEPVPEFATTVGINLNLITPEGYLILSERSSRTATEPRTFHTSVGEGFLRPGDAGPDGAPDPFHCAIRGTKEEIGISLNREDVEFNAFCVHQTRGQYSLFGWSRIKETKSQIEMLRTFAVAQDKWENHTLHFLLCNPASVAQFLVTHLPRWSDTGLASLIFSLMQEGYSIDEISKAFFHIRPTIV